MSASPAANLRAPAAGAVQPGSTAYHFDGLDARRGAAFVRLADTAAARFTARLARPGRPDLRRGPGHAMRLGDGLYAVAARRLPLRRAMRAGMAVSRTARRQRCPPDKAEIRDALIAGLSIHRSVDPQRCNAPEPMAGAGARQPQDVKLAECVSLERHDPDRKTPRRERGRLEQAALPITAL